MTSFAPKMDSEDSDSIQDESPQNQVESSRVARYFMYRHRERQGASRAQLRPILDEFQEKSKQRRTDPIASAGTVLDSALGLSLAQGRRPGEKAKSSGRYYVVRARAYPDNAEIPFTDSQRAEYGLLVRCFFFIHYKGTRVTVDQLAQFVKDGAERYPELGTVPELISKWASAEYLKLARAEDANSQAKCVEFGRRFYAEFGVRALEAMAAELVTGERPSVEEEEEEARDEE